MIGKMRAWWICGVAAFFWAHLSYALNFTEFGAISIGLPDRQINSDSSLKTSPAISWGGGVTLGLGLSDHFEIESGLIYMPRGLIQSSAIVPGQEFSFGTLQVPILIRYRISNPISVGAGPYIAHGLGSVTVTQGGSSSVSTLNDVSFSRNDLGICASLRFQNHVTELISLVWDERVLWGFTNLDATAAGGFLFREIQSWIGIGFVL